MDEAKAKALIEEGIDLIKQGEKKLLAAFEETGGWDHEMEPRERRVVSNLQSARSHASRALMVLER